MTETITAETKINIQDLPTVYDARTTEEKNGANSMETRMNDSLCISHSLLSTCKFTKSTA